MDVTIILNNIEGKIAKGRKKEETT